MAALQTAHLRGVSLTLGDQALFARLVRALDMPDAIVARLERNFGAPDSLDRLIDGLTETAEVESSDDAVVAMALAQDRDGLQARVESMMDAAGLSPRVGRRPLDIVERMIEKALAARFVLDKESEAKLRAFLRLESPLDQAEDALARFAEQHSVDFNSALEDFSKRLAGLKTQGLDLAHHTYRASFGRKLEYYTGILFEAVSHGITVAGGGRYDRLCSLLGSSQPVPAVGFSIALDRLEAALKASS